MDGSDLSPDSRVGDYTYIGYRSNITKSNIGRYCSIANNCSIGQGEHKLDRISTNSIFYDNPYQLLTEGDVNIGHDVWIAVDSIVRRGITMGIGSVLGANSFLNIDLPPFAIAAGNPARIIKYRFSDEHIKLILDSQWFNYDLENARRIIKDLENIIKS